jgi:transcription termination factor Rho
VYEVEELENVHRLDLSNLDRVKPNFRTPKEQEAYGNVLINMDYVYSDQLTNEWCDDI